MDFLYKLVVDYVPKTAVVGLWVNYILNQTYLWLAVVLTIYALLLYFVSTLNQVDGFIEVSEEPEGAKRWNLVLDRSPDTLQDKNRIIFQVRKELAKSQANPSL